MPPKVICGSPMTKICIFLGLTLKTAKNSSPGLGVGTIATLPQQILHFVGQHLHPLVRNWSAPEPLELRSPDQLNGAPLTDNFQNPTVCLDDLLPKRQEGHLATRHWDLFHFVAMRPETSGHAKTCLHSYISTFCIKYI